MSQVSILEKIRKLFGGAEIPDDAVAIYRLSKTEGEALDRMEAERGRSDRHREVRGDLVPESGDPGVEVAPQAVAERVVALLA